MELAPQAPAVEGVADAHKAAREMGACQRRQPTSTHIYWREDTHISYYYSDWESFFFLLPFGRRKKKLIYWRKDTYTLLKRGHTYASTHIYWHEDTHIYYYYINMRLLIPLIVVKWGRARDASL